MRSTLRPGIQRERASAHQERAQPGGGEPTLGVSVWSLGEWIKAQGRVEALSQSKAMAVETPEQREIRRLRQQCEHLTRQRDILKKALGILLAEMPPSDTR